MPNQNNSSTKIEIMDKGILFMLLSAMLGSLSGAVAKVLSDTMDPIEIVFYRNLLGIFLILYSFKKVELSVSFNFSKFHLLFLRGFFGTVAMVCYFYTIAHIPLGEAVILNKTSPFFVTIFAYYLMKESISMQIIFALIIGFAGVVFVVQPFDFVISTGHILGVLGGIFAAAAYATIKKIKDVYDARVIMLSFMGVGTILPLLLFLFTPYAEFKVHTGFFVWSMIALMALLSTVSQWFLTRAYSLSKASIIGVIGYSSIPFAVGFGVMLGDSIPNMLTFLGIGLIAFGGFLVNKK